MRRRKRYSLSQSLQFPDRGLVVVGGTPVTAVALEKRNPWSAMDQPRFPGGVVDQNDLARRLRQAADFVHGCGLAMPPGISPPSFEIDLLTMLRKILHEPFRVVLVKPELSADPVLH